jgi:F0F1-type ATP synthase membrane subunit c/vacuolar-type H+-ATPase subunit K
MKIMAFSFASAPLFGCAIATGVMFSSFIKGVGYSPDLEDSLFSLTMMGFAPIETFTVLTLAIIGVIYSF